LRHSLISPLSGGAGSGYENMMLFPVAVLKNEWKKEAKKIPHLSITWRSGEGKLIIFWI
jgi:hypothetical protein